MKKIENDVCLRDFGEWIKATRKRKGMSQSELATMVGVSQPWYCRIESAEREVDLMTAMKICQVLGLDISDFTKTYM